MAELTLQEAYDQAKAALDAGAGNRAAAICRHLLRYYPRYIEGYRLLGEVYLEQGAWAEAGRIFAHVLSADPQNVLAHVGRAIIAEEQGDIDEAVAELERGFEVDPAIGELRAELLRLYKELYGATGASVRLTPLGLAYTHLRAGLLETAIAELVRILTARPDRWDAQVALLEALWRKGQLAEATRLAGIILDAHPDCVKANWLLGYLHWTEGQLDTGRAYLSAAVALDPDYSSARKLWAGTPWPLDAVLTTEQPALVPGWTGWAEDQGLALPPEEERAVPVPAMPVSAQTALTAAEEEPAATVLPAWAIGASAPVPTESAEPPPSVTEEAPAVPASPPALDDWFGAWVESALATPAGNGAHPPAEVAEASIVPTNGWTDVLVRVDSAETQDDLIDLLDVLARAESAETQDDLIDLIDALTQTEARAIAPPVPPTVIPVAEAGPLTYEAERPRRARRSGTRRTTPPATGTRPRRSAPAATGTPALAGRSARSRPAPSGGPKGGSYGPEL